MSIGSEITRIRNAKADIISFLKENGISIPDGISIDDLNYYVEQYMAGRPIPTSNSIFYTFNSAGSVTDVRLSTEKVRGDQFNEIGTLRSVTFIYPNMVTSIGERAFLRCSSLALTSLPDGLTSIGQSAFAECGKLALTKLPDGLTSIEYRVFFQCTNLALTELPSGITSIGGTAFYDCRNLALTELPSGITSIGSTAFCGCTSLTSLTFKGTPDSIGSDAFKNCTNLVDIKVPWSDGAVAGAPWGATNATITYDYVPTT